MKLLESDTAPYYFVVGILLLNVAHGMITSGTTALGIADYQVYINNFSPTYSCTTTNPGTMTPTTGVICENAISSCAVRFYWGSPSANTNGAGSDLCFYGALTSFASGTYPTSLSNGITSNGASCTMTLTITQPTLEACYWFTAVPGDASTATIYQTSNTITIKGSLNFYASLSAPAEATAQGYFAAKSVRLYSTTSFCTVSGCNAVGTTLPLDCSAFTYANPYCTVTVTPTSLSLVGGTTYRLCQVHTLGPITLTSNVCIKDLTYDATSVVTITMTQTTQNRMRYVKAAYTSTFPSSSTDYLALWPSSSSPTACSGCMLSASKVSTLGVAPGFLLLPTTGATIGTSYKVWYCSANSFFCPFSATTSVTILRSATHTLSLEDRRRRFSPTTSRSKTVMASKGEESRDLVGTGTGASKSKSFVLKTQSRSTSLSLNRTRDNTNVSITPSRPRTVERNFTMTRTAQLPVPSTLAPTSAPTPSPSPSPNPPSPSPSPSPEPTNMIENTTRMPPTRRPATLTKPFVIPRTTFPPKKSNKRTQTKSRTLLLTNEEFLVKFSDDPDALTTDRKNAILEAFVKLSPGTLKNNVRILKVERGSSVVRFLVQNVSYQDWPTTKQTIIAGSLLPAGAVSDVIPAQGTGNVTTANATETLITTCQSSVTLSGNTPTVGTGSWSVLSAPSSADVVIVSATNPTSKVSVPVGTSVLQWTISMLGRSSTVNVTITRVSNPAITLSVSKTLTNNSNEISVVGSISNTSTVISTSWKAIGSAEVLDTKSLTTTVKGFGKITVEFVVQDSLCGLVSALTSVTLAEDTQLCRANTTCSGHGVCKSTGTCSCYDSSLVGYSSGLHCERCSDGYIGSACTTSVCVNGSTSCVHGSCVPMSGGGWKCLCNTGWGGRTCSECSASSTTGFYAGVTCSECADGFSGTTCTVLCDAATDCSGHGTCSKAGCECFESDSLGYWSGMQCNHCKYPFLSPGCKTVCTNHITCSGHGECVAVSGSNSFPCKCYQDTKLGYYASSNASLESYCDVCDRTHTGSSCLQRVSTIPCSSVCIHGSCDPNGNCVCIGHWDGVNCDMCAAREDKGYWNELSCTSCLAGYYGENCDKPCPYNKCSNRGRCDQTYGLCQCNSTLLTGMWDGSVGCSACMKDYYGSLCTRYCTSDTCGGHGICTSQGTCQCTTNVNDGMWSGETCSVCLGSYTAESGCKACRVGFYGDNCLVACDAALTCSGHGTCQSITGLCQCFSDSKRGYWGGEGCSTCIEGYEGLHCLDVLSVGTACEKSLLLKLHRVTYTTAFHAIQFVFDQATDQGYRLSRRVSRKCTSYFDENTLHILGSSAVCEWLTPAILQVLVYNDATVSVGTSVAPMNGVLFAVDDEFSTNCSTGSRFTPLPLQAPPSTRTPLAVITSLPFVNFCEDITLNSGSSTFSSPKMVLKYSVSIADTTKLALARRVQNFLDLQPTTLTSVTIPNRILGTVAAEFVFTLTLRDGNSGVESEHDVTVEKLSASNPAPSVAIKGLPERTVSRFSKLQLLTHAAFNPCLPPPSIGMITFKWSISPQVPTMLDSTQPTWLIPAYTLRPDLTYIVKLTATDPHNNNVTASVLIHTISSNLTARIVPFNKSANNVTVQCIFSDPDRIPTDSETFSWDCLDGCTPQLRSVINASTDSLLKFRFPIPSAGPRLLTLVVNFRKGLRSVSTTTSFSVLFDSQRNFTVNINGPTVALRSARSMYSTTVQGNQYQYQWSCVLPCTMNFNEKNVVTLQGSTMENLVLLPKSVPAGGHFTIRVDVLDTKTNSWGSATMDIVGSTPPEGGRVVASVYTPVAFDTVTFSALDWIADPNAGSLTYQWTLIDETGVAQPVSEESSNTVISLTILQPNLDTSLCQVSVTIRDQRGEFTTLGISIVVHKAPVEVENRVISSALMTIQDLHRQGSSSRVVQTLLTATWGSMSTLPDLFDSAMNILNNITITEDLVAQVSSVVATLSSQSSYQLLRNQSIVVQNVVTSMLSTDVVVDNTIQTNLLQTIGVLGSALGEISQKGDNEIQQRTTQSLRDTIGLSTTLGIKSMMGAASSESRVVNTGTFTMGCVVKGHQRGISTAPNRGLYSELTLSVNDPTPPGTFCQTQWGVNIFSSVQFAKGKRNVTSGVTSIVYSAGGSDELQQPLRSNISFVLYRTRPRLRKNTRSVCSYYDFSLRMFNSAGCTVQSSSLDGSEVTCVCNHLTDFTLEEEDTQQILPRTRIDVGNFAEIKVGGIIYIAVISGIFCLLAVIQFCYDQYTQKMLLETFWTGVTANQVQRRGSIMRFKYSQFPFNAEYCDSAPLAGYGFPPALSALRMKNLLKSAMEFHPWLAPLTANPSSAHTMPQRGWLLACLTLNAMMWNGIFFASEKDNDRTKVVNYIYALVLLTMSAPVVTNIVKYCFTRTMRTPLDVRHWYVPHSARGIAEAPVSTAEHINSKSCGIPQRDEYLTFNSYELEEIETSLRRNANYLCAISVSVIRLMLREEPVSNPLDNDSCFKMEHNAVGSMEHFNVSSRPPFDETTEDDMSADESDESSHPYWHRGHVDVDVVDVVFLHHSRISPADVNNNTITYDEDDGFVDEDNVIQLSLNSWMRAQGGGHFTEMNHKRRSSVATDGNEYANFEEYISKCVEIMWAKESQRPAWRMAVFAVEQGEYLLGECLFETALLLDVPEMYFVMYKSSLSQNLSTLEVLNVICSQCKLRHNVVGIAWAQYYASKRHKVSTLKYKALSGRCECPTALTLKVLLGLEFLPSYLAFGCVDYSLGVEHESTNNLLTLQEVIDSLPQSKLRAAHYFRMFVSETHDEHINNRSQEDAMKDATRSTPFVNLSSVRDWIGNRRTSRTQLHTRRYVPFQTTEDSFDLGSYLPGFVRNKVLEIEMTHSNVFATIEMGRLLAMLFDKITFQTSFAQFAKTYQEEVETVRSHGPQMHIEWSSSEGWSSGSRNGTRFQSRQFSQGNNHFPPTRAGMTTPPYLVSCINYHATGQIGIRFAMGAASPTTDTEEDKAATSQKMMHTFARYHPPRFRGSGSYVCPHTSWLSVESNLCVGDVVYLLSGTYPSVGLSNLMTFRHSPIVFLPFEGSLAHLGEPAAVAVSKSRKSLDASKPVVIEGMEEDPSVIRITNCPHQRWVGVGVYGHDIGMQVENCEGFEVTDCTVQAKCCGMFADGIDHLRVGSNNTSISKGTEVGFLLRVKTLMFPPWMLVLMYVIVLGIYVLFAMMCLFVTSAMSESEANEWLRRTGISLCIKIVLISPVTCVAQVCMRLWKNTADVDLGSGMDFDLGE